MPKRSLLPFIILGAGFVWMALLEWLRRQKWMQVKGSESAQGPQYLTLLGLAGLLACMVGAAIVAYQKWM